MKAKLISKTGKTKSDYDLPSIFDIKPNSEILSLYLKIFLGNQRQSNAHTKTRGEVSGSTRKLYKQKGTGNARRGSLRSPIMKGGGVVFGPTNNIKYKRSLPKSLRRLAILSSFVNKVESDAFYVFDKSDDLNIKTLKSANEYLQNAKIEGKILIVNSELDVDFVKAFANLPKVKTAVISELNAYDVVNSDSILFSKSALDKADEIWKK